MTKTKIILFQATPHFLEKNMLSFCFLKLLDQEKCIIKNARAIFKMLIKIGMDLLAN